MTEEIKANVETAIEPVETTQIQPSVDNAKPYDDELLDAYAKEASEFPTDETKILQEKPEEVKEEAKEEIKQEEKPGERKGDTVDDGFENLPIKKIINGKEVEFKVKDAIQAYTQQQEFNRNMDRRSTAIAQKEKKWTEDQENFKTKVGDLIKVAQGGDFITAIRALAKIATSGTGLDVVEFEKKYFSQLDNVRDVYTKMTPEQREAFFAKRQAEDARERAKALEEEKVVNTQRNQLQEQVNTLQKQYGIEDREFWENYKTLESSQVGEDKLFKNRDEIKAEDVVRYTLAVRHEEKVLKASEKFGIQDEAILDKISEVTSRDLSLTVEDIARIIEASGIAKNANPKAVENLNRKAQKSGVQFNQGSSTKKENGKIEGLDKDDLEFLYRNQPKVYQRPNR